MQKLDVKTIVILVLLVICFAVGLRNYNNVKRRLKYERQVLDYQLQIEKRQYVIEQLEIELNTYIATYDSLKSLLNSSVNTQPIIRYYEKRVAAIDTFGVSTVIGTIVDRYPSSN